MKKLTTLTIISFIFLTNLFGQNSNMSVKDSLMQFLVRGLWIQYEIEKGWNPNNDTLIHYSESEKDIYYRNILANFGSDSLNAIAFQEDTIYLSIPRYTESTAKLFEEKTTYKRTFNYTNHRILLFSKELIENWTDWYENNPDSIDIDELKEIIANNKK